MAGSLLVAGTLGTDGRRGQRPLILRLGQFESRFKGRAYLGGPRGQFRGTETDGIPPVRPADILASSRVLKILKEKIEY